MTKYKEAVEELSVLEEKLAEAERLKQTSESSGGGDDDLDTYMKKLKSQVPDKHKRVNWKVVYLFIYERPEKFVAKY